MKFVIFISGILGIILLVLGIVGNLSDSISNQLMIFAGLALLLVLCVPMFLFSKYKQEKKNKEIIDSGKYKDT